MISKYRIPTSLRLFSTTSPSEDHEQRGQEGDVRFVPKQAYLGAWKSRVKHLKRQVTSLEYMESRKEAMEGSKKLVGLAIASNMLMFSGKMYGAVQSGSASMFSEALHSLADVLNECLLMWGIWRSTRQPDGRHPYGYRNERYAWALVSGVGIFFLGGGVSMYHGISGLLLGSDVIGDATAAFWVLGSSLVFETFTVTYAYRQMAKQAAFQNIPFMDYLRSGADPTTVQVFLEDCAAITGVAIAGTCLGLSRLLSMPLIDSIGSISIGLLLSGIATYLIRRNISGLLETSLHPAKERHIVSLLQSDPVVVSVHDVKSTGIGPDWARFKAEILFNGQEVTRRYIVANASKMDNDIEHLKTLKTDQEIKEWLVQHGAHVITSLGNEVDRLELNIKAHHPQVHHIDLEIL